MCAIDTRNCDINTRNNQSNIALYTLSVWHIGIANQIFSLKFILLLRILGNGTSILSSYIMSPIVPQLLPTLLHVHGSLIANSIEDTNDTLKYKLM